MKNINHRQIIISIVFLVLGVTMLFLVSRKVDVETTWITITTASFGWIILSRFVTMVGNYLRAKRWNLMIDPIGYQPSAYNTFKAVLIGYAANLVFPKMGEVFRCWSLNRTDKIPVNKLLGTVVVERVIDFLCLMIVILLVFVLRFNLIKDFFYEKIFINISNKISGVAGSYVIWLSGFILVMCVILLIFYRHKSWNPYFKIKKLFIGIWEGISSIQHMRRRGGFLAYTVVMWLLYWINIKLDFMALGITRDLGMIDALTILALSGLSMAAPVQGGIGAYQWMVVHGLMLFGLTYDGGYAFATLVWVSVILLIAVSGGWALISVLYSTAKSLPEEIKKEGD